MNKALTIGLTVLFILIMALPVFSQDMTHQATYELDGIIDLEKQVGHLCNTGAEAKQTIEGEGQISKVMDTTQVAGKLTVLDSQDWVTAEDALRNLTVTSVIELCAPPKTEYTTTKYVPVASTTTESFRVSGAVIIILEPVDNEAVPFQGDVGVFGVNEIIEMPAEPVIIPPPDLGVRLINAQGQTVDSIDNITPEFEYINENGEDIPAFFAAYEFTGVAPGVDYVVKAIIPSPEKGDLEKSTEPFDVIDRDVTGKDIIFRDSSEEPTPTILSGRVIDKYTSDPIEDARVTVWGGPQPRPDSVDTDEDGFYALEFAGGSGTYRLSAYKDEYVEIIEELEIVEGDGQTFNFELAQISPENSSASWEDNQDGTGRITITVKDIEDDPITGIARAQFIRYKNTERSLLSNLDGTIKFVSNSFSDEGNGDYVFDMTSNETITETWDIQIRYAVAGIGGEELIHEDLEVTITHPQSQQ